MLAPDVLATSHCIDVLNSNKIAMLFKDICIVINAYWIVFQNRDKFYSSTDTDIIFFEPKTHHLLKIVTKKISLKKWKETLLLTLWLRSAVTISLHPASVILFFEKSSFDSFYHEKTYTLKIFNREY